MYEKQNWEDGDIITAQKMNHIEDGIEKFVVIFSGSTENEDAACDKTFSEIAEAYSQGKEISLKYYNGTEYFDLLKSIIVLNESLEEIHGYNYSLIDPFSSNLGYVFIGVAISATEIYVCLERNK